MTRNALLFSTLIAFTFLTPASAQEAAKTPPVAEQPATAKKESPAKEEKSVDLRQPSDRVQAQSSQNGPAGATKKWIDTENAMIDPLDEKGKETILILRNKYSLINATRIVSRDVGAAVKSCGDKNPDLKQQMDDRYKQWSAAVTPILDTANKQLKKDIDALKIVKPAEFRKVLDLHDKAYEAAEKQITKMPVTTPDACKGTLASMDRTEDNMIRILQQTLLPESVIRKRAAEEEKSSKAETSGDKTGDKPSAKTQE